MLNGHGDDAFKYKDIRINFSSNIYSHADMKELKKYLSRHLDVIDSYPEPEPYSLQQLIANHVGVGSNCVLATNGATEAIYLIAQMLKSSDYNDVAIENPTFREYEDACTIFGITTSSTTNAQENSSKVMWICNPNNPTGRVYDDNTIVRLAQNRKLLIIDQSYEEHTLKPIMTAKKAIDCGNIIQIHSLTKTYAIPGLRIGYITAAPRIIEKLRQYMRPWAVNAIATEAAKWLLTHNIKAVANMKDYLKETQRLRTQLNSINNIEAMPTETNFMLARIGSMTSGKLKQQLAEEHHILIRDASNFKTLDQHYIRIATQRPDENDILCNALKQCFERNK